MRGMFRDLGSVAISRYPLTSIGIPMLKTIRSQDRLLFNKRIPIPGWERLSLYGDGALYYILGMYRTPNLRIYTECSNHLSYRDQTFPILKPWAGHGCVLWLSWSKLTRMIISIVQKVRGTTFVLNSVCIYIYIYQITSNSMLFLFRIKAKINPKLGISGPLAADSPYKGQMTRETPSHMTSSSGTPLLTWINLNPSMNK